jgi:hypothetical protein
VNTDRHCAGTHFSLAVNGTVVGELTTNWRAAMGVIAGLLTIWRADHV